MKQSIKIIILISLSILLILSYSCTNKKSVLVGKWEQITSDITLNYEDYMNSDLGNMGFDFGTIIQFFKDGSLVIWDAEDNEQIPGKYSITGNNLKISYGSGDYMLISRTFEFEITKEKMLIIKTIQGNKTTATLVPYKELKLTTKSVSGNWLLKKGGLYTPFTNISGNVTATLNFINQYFTMTGYYSSWSGKQETFVPIEGSFKILNNDTLILKCEKGTWKEEIGKTYEFKAIVTNSRLTLYYNGKEEAVYIKLNL